MVYAIIAGGVFLSDLILKRYMDKKYARKVRHPRLGGRIVLEKYYNKGAALNFMVKKPNLLRYTKGHVVDYFHLNFGPKWLRAIVFNISDFCIFIGALLAVAGSEVS